MPAAPLPAMAVAADLDPWRGILEVGSCLAALVIAVHKLLRSIHPWMEAALIGFALYHLLE